jgi:hypothetical protein
MKIVGHSLSGFDTRNGWSFSESVVPWRNSLLDDRISAPATDVLIVAQVAPITAPFGAVNALLCAYEIHTFLRADPVSLGSWRQQRQASQSHSCRKDASELHRNLPRSLAQPSFSRGERTLLASMTDCASLYEITPDLRLGSMVSVRAVTAGKRSAWKIQPRRRHSASIWGAIGKHTHP